MKQLISLIAISLVSLSAFAGTPSASSTAASLSAVWKHQNTISLSNHNLIMIGGQDISNKSLLDGPTAAA